MALRRNEERGCLEVRCTAWIRDTSPFFPWVSADHQDMALLPIRAGEFQHQPQGWDRLRAPNRCRRAALTA